MCTCTVLTFISWSLTGLYLITRSTCLAFRPDILEFKIVRLSIQRKSYCHKLCTVVNFELFSAVLSIRTSFRNTFYFMNITGKVSSLEGEETTQMKFKRIVATVFSEEGGGGGDGGHNPLLPIYPILLPFSETEETLTQLTQSTCLHMCHSISFMTYDVSNLERFPISLEVMLFFFFYPEYKYLFLDFFCRQNFAFSLGEC